MPGNGRWEIEGMKVLDDVAPASWLVDKLWPRSEGGVWAGEIVPEGFEAYVRIFHPAYRPTEAPGVDERIAWHTIAGWTERIVHPAMQFHRIANLPDDTLYNWNLPYGLEEPCRGELPLEDALALVRVLRAFTSTPGECYFCVWDGYAGLDAHYDSLPKVQTAKDWRYWLFQGPIHGAVGELHQGHGSPNIYWPKDRAWCVVTHVDFTETYVGGSQECVDQILLHSRWIAKSPVRSSLLEALQIPLDTRIDAWGDGINPAAEVAGIRH